MSGVAVIGGGPCGLFAALLLSRQGIGCTVFERREGISTHPKAMGLTRRTCEIFRQNGLLEAIEEGALDLGGRDLALWSRTLAGEEFGRVAMPPEAGALTPCRPLHCPQTWTEQVLLDAIVAGGGAEVRFSTVVGGMEQGESSVLLHLERGKTFEASWVVAADGAGSRARSALHIDTQGPGDLGHFINTMFRADYGERLRDRRAILYNTLDAPGYEFFVTVDGSRLWLMHHFLQPGETPGDFPRGRLEEIIKRASGMPEVPVEILSTSAWVMSPCVARRWREGRVFLVGDAAARLSPAGGLGLNTGLQGVHNLAWKLASVLRGQAGESLLDSYEAERRPCALGLMRETNRNADEIFAVVASGMRGNWDAVRETIAHSRRGGAGLGTDLGFRYEHGAFLDDAAPAREPSDPANEYLPDAKPGARAPHVPVTAAAGRASTLDLPAGGFAALAGRAGGAWRHDSLPFFQNGIDFEAPAFEKVHGITSAGVVLVRPDGCVAARFAGTRESGQPDLGVVMDRILGV
jgi:putative polyketide hydroxylase